MTKTLQLSVAICINIKLKSCVLHSPNIRQSFIDQFYMLHGPQDFKHVFINSNPYFSMCCSPTRHEMSLRDVNQISIEKDILEASWKYLKRDEFFMKSLRRLSTSQKMSFV